MLDGVLSLLEQWYQWNPTVFCCLLNFHPHPSPMTLSGRHLIVWDLQMKELKHESKQMPEFCVRAWWAIQQPAV